LIDSGSELFNESRGLLKSLINLSTITFNRAKSIGFTTWCTFFES